MTDSIENAMKLHGLELDNGLAAGGWRFMVWQGSAWHVYEIGDVGNITRYEGDDLGRALAALIGEQP